jgi:prepilin-type processing-associated H-X9-DG protein
MGEWRYSLTPRPLYRGGGKERAPGTNSVPFNSCGARCSSPGVRRLEREADRSLPLGMSGLRGRHRLYMFIAWADGHVPY